MGHIQWKVGTPGIEDGALSDFPSFRLIFLGVFFLLFLDLEHPGIVPFKSGIFSRDMPSEKLKQLDLDPRYY